MRDEIKPLVTLNPVGAACGRLVIWTAQSERSEGTLDPGFAGL